MESSLAGGENVKSGLVCVPDRILRSLRTQPCNIAVTQAQSSGHDSLPGKDGRQGFGCLVDRRIGKMRVLQSSRRVVVAEKPADREDRLAMGESPGSIGVSLTLFSYGNATPETSNRPLPHTSLSTTSYGMAQARNTSRNHDMMSFLCR